MGSQKRGILPTERDLLILRFLWRWKLATTATLSARFFPKQQVVTCYNRLVDLRRAGLIEQRPDERLQNYYWMLTKRGFLASIDSIPERKEDGYKSEYIAHDAMVMALHLGEWLLEAPSGVRFYSEQQLRRHESDVYPAWIPKSEEHRPDGYWGFTIQNKIVPAAIEVEMNRKSTAEYEKVADFYSRHKDIGRVIWITPSEKTAIRIQKAMGDGSTSRPEIHNYVDLHQFKELGWFALIFLGLEKGLTLYQFLNGICGKAGETPVERPANSPGLSFFQGRKSYVKSKPLPKSLPTESSQNLQLTQG